MREKQGLAATVLVLLGIVLIGAPTAVLMSSLGDSVHQLIRDVQANSLAIPAPRDGDGRNPRDVPGSHPPGSGLQLLMSWVASNPDVTARTS
jgi:hypothetical protein